MAAHARVIDSIFIAAYAYCIGATEHFKTNLAAALILHAATRIWLRKQQQPLSNLSDAHQSHVTDGSGMGTVG